MKKCVIAFIISDGTRKWRSDDEGTVCQSPIESQLGAGKRGVVDMKLHALDPLLYPPEEDILHSENKFIKHFYELIGQSIEPPYAVSIDGVWGSGKTTVMKTLEKELQASSYPTFWFNPWEYRQTQNVVLAFLQCLAGTYKDILKEMKNSTTKIFRVLLEAGMDAGLKMVTSGTLNLKDIKDTLKGIEDKQLPSYERYQNTIETIKSEFGGLVRHISQKHKNRPVIIFFDDLDRCLPEDAIQLLEALKNLFVTRGCNAIFICGIDTHVAKQFIKEHYKGIEEDFSINYFRKIFNLTISMPHNSDIYSLLLNHIKGLFDWDDPQDRKSKPLAEMIESVGRQAQIYSARKYLNIVDNFHVFLTFNPDYRLNLKEDFIVYLLILKEAWQPIFEDLIKSAFNKRSDNMEKLVYDLIVDYRKTDSISFKQRRFLSGRLGTKSKFAQEFLYKWLTSYPTLS